MRTHVILTVMLSLLVAVGAWAQSPSPAVRTREHGPSPEVLAHQHTERVEIYRLRIVNDVDGAITGSRDGGATWQPLGRVTAYTERTTDQGYTASKWAPVGAVAATAVNAIHIRTGYNPKDDKGVVFSVLPKEMQTETGVKLQSFLSPDSSIYTDISGGTSLFGGHWSPILGNPVLLEAGAELIPLAADYTPKRGDVLIIRVMEAVNAPRAFVFENRFGGLITMEDWDGNATVIGQVLKPVSGVGRFTGTQYAGVGRLRANHNGVIDISVSPYGAIGGFQIIPREHAMSPEMVRARTMTQWMVVGPLDARDPSWEGTGPLFLGYLRPSWSENDIESPDWRFLLTDRVTADVRVKDGPWQMMPTFVFDPDMSKPLPDWCMTALQDVTHIRISLPVSAAVRKAAT